MKGCSSWLDAIDGCALGKTPEPDFASHLAICPECENALRDSRAVAGRIDEALQRRAAVEPPLYGPERVMARIRNTARHAQGQSDTRLWWRWAAVGSAVLVVLIAIVMWVRRPTPEPDITALSTWQSPTQALLRPPLPAAWNATPRLGVGFLKMKPLGEIHAQ